MNSTYETLERLEQDFRIVAYGRMGIPFKWSEMHLVKLEDIDKTKPCQAGSYDVRYFKKVLPIRTKDVPSLSYLLKCANNYKLDDSHNKINGHYFYKDY